MPTSEWTIESAQLNPRFRLDVAPLSPEQAALADLDFGPYRIGDSDVISPLYPVAALTGMDGRSGNLIQSDCLWLAHDSQSGSGDRVAFSWEETWTLQLNPEATPRSVDDRTVGMCTISQPQTRQLLIAEELGIDVLDNPTVQDDAALYVASSTEGLRFSDVPVALPGERVVFACRNSDHLATA